MATQFAAIPREAFAITKRQMRAQAIGAVSTFLATPENDSSAQWSSEESRARIAAYMEKTVGKK